MSNHHHFEVNLPQNGIGGKILMDGEEVRGVRAIKVEARVDSLTVVTLEVLASIDMTSWCGVKFKPVRETEAPAPGTPGFLD